MKATELMIDDLVLVDRVPRKVEQLTRHKVGYHVKSNECRMHYARFYAIEPIPITHEILRKIGFYPGQHSDFLSGISSDYRVEYLGSNRFTIKSDAFRLDIICKYVHELQHVLRLCKIDKEIKL